MRKGSITVEASLIFPIFFFFIMGFMYLFSMLSIHTTVQKALTDTANTVSLSCYFNEENMSRLLMQIDFNQNIEKDYLGKACVLMGNIALLKSRYDKDEIILTANYGIKIPLPLWNKRIIWMEQTVKTRKFVGKPCLEEGEGGEEFGEEDYVYIAENGTVYHKTTECTHLRLSIQEVGREALNSSRNQAGGKYKECELCGKGKSINECAILYITLEGDRYHYEASCSGLKRTIRKVPLKDAADLGECKRCALNN